MTSYTPRIVSASHEQEPQEEKDARPWALTDSFLLRRGWDKEPALVLTVEGLGSGTLATAKGFAAWAALLASHGFSAWLLNLPQDGGDSPSLREIQVQWHTRVGDLVRSLRNAIEDLLTDAEGDGNLLDQNQTEAPGGDGNGNGHGHVLLEINTRPESGAGGDALVRYSARDNAMWLWAAQMDESPFKTVLPHLIQQYEDTVCKIRSPGTLDTPLADMRTASFEDLRQIWAWNTHVPRATQNVCVHELFMERARQHPALPAVSAHDGELTYGELDDLSTRLAYRIISGGIRPGSIILVLIEKSMWVPVAQLAIMKSGCASTVLDASLPAQRQRAIAELVRPAAVMTSPGCAGLAEALDTRKPQYVLSRHNAHHCWPSPPSPGPLLTVDPSSWLYVVFTSGSTGVPKGVIITHTNYTGAVLTQQERLDFREFDRVFDFASYAFDASWCNVIHALTIGGCLCVPSDEERVDDLPRALRKYEVNYAVLTPSVAWFSASELPASLRTIHFGGEPLKAAVVRELSTRVTVINAYGPAECSTVSTAATVTPPSDDADPSIGTGLGACTWVVNLDGTDLVPVGETGELWLEGPIVGEGYLDNPGETAAAFLDGTPWLVRGCPGVFGVGGYTGRRGRLYRTGDLVRYGQDGRLEFVCRKGSQIKIHGQRVEIEEIEAHLHRALRQQAAVGGNIRVVADMIKPHSSSGSSTLVAFILTADALTLPEALESLSRRVFDRLQKMVPHYMIPSAFLSIDQMPMTPTGKLDRQRLRDAGANLYWQQFGSGEEDPTDALAEEDTMTPLESKMRDVWSDVLNVASANINLNTWFTRLGGDSITAMQVASRCRAQNMSIKIADILSLKTLRLVARASKPVRSMTDGIKKNPAHDGDGAKPWPLSPIQQMFFDDNPQGVNHYTLSYIVKLARQTSQREFLSALVSLTTRHAMLRARFRKSAHGSSGWEQYVAPAGPDSFLFATHTFVDRDAMQDAVNQRQATLDLVKGPVFAVDVFQDAEGGPQTLLMSAHHVVMDLVSWRIVWRELSRYLSVEAGTFPHTPTPAPTPPPPGLSFQSWCYLQLDEAKSMDPATAFPFSITPADFDYWAVTPAQLLFRDTVLHVSTVGAEATALLLGASNDHLRTEVLEILVGCLVFSFSRTFRDRDPPPVFLEGHGREPVGGEEMQESELFDVVGWFTTVFPVEVETVADESVLAMITAVKDTLRKVPGKGRPYFASMLYNNACREVFEAHRPMELIFNYRGSFQQLESADSLFQWEDRAERNIEIPGSGPDYRRPSLIDMNLVVVQGGCLEIRTVSHRNMRNHESVARWMDLYVETLTTVSHELARRQQSPRLTLADVPLLNISYAGLAAVVKQLAERGIEEAHVQDIYPCTPMQEGILLSFYTNTASYQSACVWRVESAPGAPSASVPRLAEAFKTMSRAHLVFSTIFASNEDTGRFIQVVLDSTNDASVCRAEDCETAEDHLQRLQPREAEPSQPQCFFTICTDRHGQVACRLDMTHALMDAQSLPAIVRGIEEAYLGNSVSSSTPFRRYVEHLQHAPASSTRLLDYWRRYLAGMKPCLMQADVAGSPSSQAAAPVESLYRCVSLPDTATASLARVCRERGLTRSVFLHLAWSLTLACLTGTRQVCFGYISSGRDSPIDGVEGIVGPLISMLIARVDLEQPLPDVVDAVNRYNVDHLEHQNVSLAEIQHELSENRLFNTNITIRKRRVNSEPTNSGITLVDVSEEDRHEYDLVLVATLGDDTTDITVQGRTDFASLTHAHEVRVVLQGAVEFLSFALGQHPPLVDLAGCSVYEAYFKATFGTDEGSAVDKWRRMSTGFDPGQYPPLPYATYVPKPSASARHTIEDLSLDDVRYDAATQILASWAVLQACYDRSPDITIGLCLHGPGRGGEDAALSRPLPLLLAANLNRRVDTYLDTVQSTVVALSEAPKLPLQRLCRLNSELTLACDFQTVWSIEKLGAAPGSASPCELEDFYYHGRVLAIQARISATFLDLVAHFDDNVIERVQVGRLLAQLETVLRQMCSPASMYISLKSIETASPDDLATISSWNATRYEAAQELIHEAFSRRARSMPDALAVSSWDGELTYSELDRHSSRLARQLACLDVGPGTVVPVYSEKSMWVPVSVMAVLKAGGTGVMMDATDRIEVACSVVSRVAAKLVITSPRSSVRAAQFEGVKLLAVDEWSMNALSASSEDGSVGSVVPPVRPSDLAYISFTSGSTGMPKGTMISHSCFVSAIRHQQDAHGFAEGQRVYDLASYSFDVSWSNLLHSLTSGSCLCIPSEDERINALSESIRRSRATLLNATPSVLRHLDPRELPDLQTVLMGGETWSEEDFLDWMDSTRLMNSYGPGESTVKTCITRAVRGAVPNTIGRGVGLNTWLVRTDASERLAPLGAVGELWLEGPQVALGYVGDEARTAAAFVTRPRLAWARGGDDGQERRFYRTGDLARYGSDGDLIFVGRRDLQVKLRGQRMQLGDVEDSIHKALLAGGLTARVIADVFTPQGSDNPVLVAFLKAEQPDASRRVLGVDERLARMVPDHMRPTTYILLDDDFPMTTTGKISRRALHDLHASLSLEELISRDALRVSGNTLPSTDAERRLRDLWAEVLTINPATVSADDSFFRIGGDSLGAMRLVGAARKRSIALTVADIFKRPRLSALARFIEEQGPGLRAPPVESTVEPFSLLDGAVSGEEARVQAAMQCGVKTADVEDVFPCTALQAGLLAETVRRPGDNVLCRTFRLGGDIDVSLFRAAWKRVVQTTPILRTRIIELPSGGGLVQVVVRHEACEEEGDEGGQITLAHEFGLGTPLSSSTTTEEGLFSWHIHHALYDAWSLRLILDRLTRCYRSGALPEAIPFQNFIKHARSSSRSEARIFWTEQFRDSDAQKFPALPSSTYQPRCDQGLELVIEGLSSLDSEHTVATRIRLAWALLLSAITHSADASFGAVLFGRQASVPGIESMAAPTFATVPLRVPLDYSQRVDRVLEQVQMQAAHMMPFEQTGIRNIRRFSEECRLGCEFQSLLVIQPGRVGSTGGDGGVENALFEELDSSAQPTSASSSKDENPGRFKHYAICLEFVLEPKLGAVRLRADHDSAVVSAVQLRRLVGRLERILRQLSSPASQEKPLARIVTSTEDDLRQIWSWNKTPWETCNETVHHVFGQVAAVQPNAPAICSWDGNFTYGQLDEASTRIAHKLMQLGLCADAKRIVPLLFEKSRWTSACQLAVMKANGTSVVIDAMLPAGRVRTLMELIQPRVVVTSADEEQRARESSPAGAQIIVISDETYDSLPLLEEARMPVVSPDNWLYVVFTSGSTGTPKGAIISHANFTSAIRHGRARLHFDANSRTFDFVSYSFDVSWLNLLFTLCSGGCLCVPSQHELEHEPTEAFRRRRADTIFTTPTVSRVFDGVDLRVINFGGEKLPLEELEHWKDRSQVMMNSYGPSECTPIGVTNVLHAATRGPVTIGTGVGLRTWVVGLQGRHGDAFALAAIGDVGELWLEGPLVGQGYLNEPEKTEAAFVKDPDWLVKGYPGVAAGRRARLYRTGDLVRYGEDGSLEFIGRKDAQVKIRGQRIELGEIEHHVRCAIGSALVERVAVDVINTVYSEPVLVAFVKMIQEEESIDMDTTPGALLHAPVLTTSIIRQLSATIPRYMIPQCCVLVDSIPCTASGKTDRVKLQKMASSLKKEDLLLRVDTAQIRTPKTAAEADMHSMVAETLSRDGSTFGMDENFIQLGGDSISAMRLSSLAWSKGISLTVAEILTKPCLADLLTEQQQPPKGDIIREDYTQGEGGSAILTENGDPRDLVQQETILSQVQPGHGELIDILPATDVQSSYIRDNLCSPRRSWFFSYVDFDSRVDQHRLIQSCKRLVACCDIYRAAFISHGESIFVAMFASWEPIVALVDEHDLDIGLSKVMQKETRQAAPLGCPLVYFTLLRGRHGRARLVFSMSHAVYDAISLDQTVKILGSLYAGAPTPEAPPFRHFLRYVQKQKLKSYAYWREFLRGSSMTMLPGALAGHDAPASVTAHAIPIPRPPPGITHATLFTLACASALSSFTGSPDVILGRVVSGRAALPESLSGTVGPCLNYLPVRMRFSNGQRREEQLLALQSQFVESLAHETSGFTDIAENCTDWPCGTRDFGCRVQYQNVEESPGVSIPGAVGGLCHREMAGKLLVRAKFLEIFAIPAGNDLLTIRVIGGLGYEARVLRDLLETVSDNLISMGHTDG